MNGGPIPDQLLEEVAARRDEAQRLLEAGDLAGHERVLLVAVAKLEHGMGADEPLALTLRYDALLPLSQTTDSAYIQKMLALYSDVRRVHGGDHSLTQRVREKLANHFEAAGQFIDAARCRGDMADSIARSDDRDDVWLAICFDNMSRNLERAGDPVGAAEACRRYLEVEQRTTPSSISGPIVRERLASAEAEIARRQAGPQTGAWPAAPPPPSPQSTFRLHRLIDYRSGLPRPNRFTPLLDPMSKRMVMGAGEQELWVHPDTECYYSLRPWDNAPFEDQWGAPGPAITVVCTTRISFLCFQFVGEQVGRDFYNRGALGGTWTGLAASMASRRQANSRAAREEQGRVMALQVPFECISLIGLVPLQEAVDGVYGAINVIMPHGEESHVVAVAYPCPLTQLRDHAQWLAALILQHRLSAPSEAPLSAGEVATLQQHLATLSPEPEPSGELYWELPAFIDGADMPDSRPPPPVRPPPPNGL